jgi:hypothetical protein
VANVFSVIPSLVGFTLRCASYKLGGGKANIGGHKQAPNEAVASAMIQK